MPCVLNACVTTLSSVTDFGQDGIPRPCSLSRLLPSINTHSFLPRHLSFAPHSTNAWFINSFLISFLPCGLTTLKFKAKYFASNDILKHDAIKSCLQNEHRTLKPHRTLSESVFFILHVKRTFEKHSTLLMWKIGGLFLCTSWKGVKHISPRCLKITLRHGSNVELHMCRI